MARVRFAEEQELTGEAKKAWDEQTANQNLTNMKKALMIATNNFNSVLKIDVDERLLPIKDEFKPATWRENIR